MKKIMALFVFAVFAFTACSPSMPTSVVGEWGLVWYGNSTSQSPAAPDVDTSIVFGADGKLDGNVGCNGFGGDYEVNGNTLTFGPIVSTLMFCEGPVGEQETTTLNVIVESATFVIEGDTLTITSADGASVIVLARK